MPLIHPTAVVSPEAELADDVQVGPYCFITGRVRLAPGVKLIGNNYLQGPLSVGTRTVLYPFACLGFEPQDYKFKPGMATAGVEVGEDCLIREHATVHAATSEHTPTRVGNRVFMMVNTHVAHDGQVGSDVVFVNGAGVAGHAVIADRVTFGGNAVVHQFVRIGRLVMMSGDCAVSLDVPPFCTVSERNRIGGLNLVGLRRNGVPREQITTLRRAFADFLRKPLPRQEVVAGLRGLAQECGCPPAAEMADFIAHSKRGITPGMGRPTRGSGRTNGLDAERDKDVALED